MTKIFIIAGEASGDQLGAALIPALQKKFPDIEFRGIGGPAMLASGLPQSLFPMEELSVMGIAEILPRVPKFIGLISKTVQAIKNFNPDFVVTIDAPDFNFRVQKRLAKMELIAKRIHYVAPTVWAWRPGRAQKVAQFLDGMICLFPFEPKYFELEGLHSCFAGHPVIQSPLMTATGNIFKESYQIDPNHKIIGLYCGSRRSEVEMSIPLLRQLIQKLEESGIVATYVFPTLPRWQNVLESAFSGISSRYIVSSQPGEKWGAMKCTDFAIAVSGTIGLEIALAGVPHAVFYKMHPVTWYAVKRLVKTRFAHLGNILLGHLVYPELLQENATAEKLYTVLTEIIGNSLEQKIQRESAKAIAQILQPNQNENAADRAAAFIKSFAAVTIN